MIQTIIVLIGIMLIMLYAIIVLVVALKAAVKELNDANAELYPVILEHFENRPVFSCPEIRRFTVSDFDPDTFDEKNWD